MHKTLAQHRIMNPFLSVRVVDSVEKRGISSLGEGAVMSFDKLSNQHPFRHPDCHPAEEWTLESPPGLSFVQGCSLDIICAQRVR